MTTPAVVAIVGAGASGTLTAAHLARAAHTAGRCVRILLCDPDDAGRGLAYATTDPRHRLNVAAKGMTAWPDDPEHFVRWLRRHVAVDFPATGFAPRQHYATYLRHVLDDTVAAAPRVELEHVRLRVTDVRPQGRRLRLTLADGTSRPVDSVVLALGHGVPAVDWAPAELRRSPRFVADPWRTSSWPIVPAGGEVVLVGAGLTMADMATRFGRDGVRVHVVSRHGMAPLAHAAEPATPVVPDGLVPDVPVGLAELRHRVFDHLRAVRASGGDWREAIDGLRPHAAELWNALDCDARKDFIRTAARRWDRVRHRVDPSLAKWLEEREADGSLRVHAGGVVGAVERDDAVEVRLADGGTVRAAAVVNCTGAGVGVRASEDPLVMNLLNAGTARPGPLDLGFATEADGRLAGSHAAIWTIGPLRRGELWESTAIPEIRVQAAELAQHVLAALPTPGTERRVRDPYGLPLTATRGAAEAYLAALGRILRVQSGAEELVAAAVEADPEFALGHAVQALLGVEWGADVDVDASLDRAHRHVGRADERERRFVEVATARVREPGARSAAALLAYIHAYPEDALAVSIAVPTIAFGGATEIPAEAWALVEGLAPAYGDNWWWQGLMAFTRQEQNRFDEARELAERALAVEPEAGHAVHAKAHVHYETGDHAAGLAWLDAWIDSSGARAAHGAHFSWHAALHELALGDDRAVARRYAAQLAPPTVTGVRALVDSASLLWRGYTIGAWDRADVRPVLDAVSPALLADPPTPFVALHAAVALAAAGDCRGLAALRRRAAARDEDVFRRTVAPLADALADLVHGDADLATEQLSALVGVDRLGGSAAQREIVEETLIYAAARAGRTDLAGAILQERLDRRPSPRDTSRIRTLSAERSNEPRR